MDFWGNYDGIDTNINLNSVQAFYRGRKSSSETKIGLRQRFDATLLKLLAKDAQSSDQEKAHSILLVTRLLPNFYTLGDTKDLSRAGKWARLVLSPLGVIGEHFVGSFLVRTLTGVSLEQTRYPRCSVYVA